MVRSRETLDAQPSQPVSGPTLTPAYPEKEAGKPVTTIRLSKCFTQVFLFSLVDDLPERESRMS